MAKPQVCNVFLGGWERFSVEQTMEALAKYPHVVITVNAISGDPTVVSRLRALNPNIKIYGFLSTSNTERWDGGPLPASGYDESWFDYKTSKAVYDNDFYLHLSDGSGAFYWNESNYFYNLTSNCPSGVIGLAEGKTFAEWYPLFVKQEVIDTYDLDGVFFDNVFAGISWANMTEGYPSGVTIDSDNDGTGDNGTTLDADWKATTGQMFSNMRDTLGDDVIIWGNGLTNDLTWNYMNGGWKEGADYLFSGYGSVDDGNSWNYHWTGNMIQYNYSYLRAASVYAYSPKMIAFQINWPFGTNDEQFYAPIKDNGTGAWAGSAQFDRNFRLWFGSSLLADGLFTFDWGYNGQGLNAWWFDEYDYELGDPRGDYYTYYVDGKQVYRRDYTGAVVIVNPNNGSVPSYGDIPAIAGWDAFIDTNAYIGDKKVAIYNQAGRDREVKLPPKTNTKASGSTGALLAPPF